MKKIDPVPLAIIAITLIIIGGILVAASLSGGVQVTQYQSNSPEKPKIEVSETKFDFGAMDVKDTKTKDIEIENTGQKPLALYDFSTSCNCTFVQLVQGIRKGPNFSMHYTSAWQGEVLPGEKAIVRITYQPSLMPVQGGVSRSVVFKTNDPDNPSIDIDFTANIK